jgi:hypothetical protein
MSALPPKADICTASGYVRFAPRGFLFQGSIIFAVTPRSSELKPQFVKKIAMQFGQDVRL